LNIKTNKKGSSNGERSTSAYSPRNEDRNAAQDAQGPNEINDSQSREQLSGRVHEEVDNLSEYLELG
jgi:hypothetical protein